MHKMVSLFILRINSVIGHAFYCLGCILFVLFVLPLVFLLTPFGPLANRFLSFAVHNYLAFLTRIFLPALGIYKIKEINGFDKIPRGKAIVIVANHRGKLDGPILLGMLKNTAAIIKSKYAISPVYAALVKKLDFITLNPRSREALEKTISRANEVLEQGKSLLIFPEGTRTASRRLLPFKELAFRIAQETNTDIYPVVIYTEFEFMTKQVNTFFPDKKNSFIIHFLAPVKSLENEHSAELAARVRDLMAKELAAIEKKEE